ncbi:MAG: F0F1 ATP synthase subunit A, partial [Ginsengibacter sp.]
MVFRSLKSLLVAVFSLILLSSSFMGFAQEKHHDAENGKEVFDPTTVILNHVQDAYEFHFFSIGDFHATIHLPVILYSPQNGFSMFSSSRFGHEGEEEYDGYKLVGGKTIVPVEEGVQVYDFSLTRNVVQNFLAMALFIWLMISVAKKYRKGQGVTSAPSGVQNFLEPII